LESLSPAEQESLWLYEDDSSLNDLVLFRALALAELDVEKENHKYSEMVRVCPPKITRTQTGILTIHVFGLNAEKKNFNIMIICKFNNFECELQAQKQEKRGVLQKIFVAKPKFSLPDEDFDPMVCVRFDNTNQQRSLRKHTNSVFIYINVVTQSYKTRHDNIC
jgi:hypothetical protein